VCLFKWNRSAERWAIRSKRVSEKSEGSKRREIGGICFCICFLFWGFDVYDATISIAVLTNHNYNVHRHAQTCLSQRERERERFPSNSKCAALTWTTRRVGSLVILHLLIDGDEIRWENESDGMILS
jgi:hypothetical protein